MLKLVGKRGKYWKRKPVWYSDFLILLGKCCVRETCVHYNYLSVWNEEKQILVRFSLGHLSKWNNDQGDLSLRMKDSHMFF